MTQQPPARPASPKTLNNQTVLSQTPKQTSLFFNLCENLRDTLFPPKLPPLELTSSPIPVPDRMAVKTNPWAIGSATLLNGSILALVLTLGLKVVSSPPTKSALHSSIDISDLLPFAPKAHAASGGGGGGANDPVDPIQGHLPHFLKTPLAPLQLPQLEHPKLSIDPAIAVELPNNPTMPDIGVHKSPNVTLLSSGPGSHGGVGIGTDGGLGPGGGIGLGPGEDRNFDGGIYTPGGAVSSPIPIVTPEAEFSDEARRAKYQGVCIISVIVDTHGNPQNPRVIRSLGMGLDEKALDAVRRYRFKPALKQGRPVPVIITVAVNFRLY